MRTISLAFIFAAAIFLLMSPYGCSHPCPFSSMAWPGLTRHQQHCAIYQTALALRMEQRRVHKSSKKPVAMLESRKERIQVRKHVLRLIPTRDKCFPSPQHSGDTPCGAPNIHSPVDDSSNSTNSSLSTPSGTTAPPLSMLVPPPPPLPSNLILTRAGRVASRLPKRYRDIQPAAPTPVPQPPSAQRSIIRRVILHVRDLMRTMANVFGLLREYHHRPSYDPDENITPEDLANFGTGDGSATSTSEEHIHSSHPPPPWPFENMTKFLLMNWVNSGSAQKTEAEITRLGREVLSSPDFKLEELQSFDAHRENQRMDQAIAAMESKTPFSRDGWQEVKVDIQIPVASRTKPPLPNQTFSVPGLHYHSLVEVIKAAWNEDMAKRFHLSPFKRIHIDPRTKVETHVYDEAYTSDAWIEAHDDLQKQLNQPGCSLEKVIAGLMFWSDSTHLTNFGTAKAWPLYLYFANLSKYIRARPNSGACHHIAFIPSV
jgi:hypothetical protein